VTSVNLTLSGSLAISWQGDGARSCATVGLCGVHGELILRSSGSGGFASSGGLSGLSAAVAGTVRARDDGQSTPGECVDLVGSSPVTPAPSVQLTRGRSWTATLSPPASSGRCAGPLGSDLSSLALPVKVRGGRYPTFDLRGTRAFTAGPFIGTAVSTMVLRTAPASGVSSGFGSSGSSTAGPGPTHRALLEHVDLRYRVSILPSSLETTFAGAADPLCEALDSCQTKGSIGLSVARAPTTVTLTASRVVRTRVSARRALEDLRSGRLTFEYPALVPIPATVTEAVMGSSGPACSETLPVSGIQVAFGPLTGPPIAHTLSLSLQNANQPNVDVFRTHCPGSAESDMIGGSGALAAGSLAPSKLLAQTNEVVLTNHGAFTGLGYTGDRAGAVKLLMSLTHVAAGTRTVRR